MTHLKYIKYSAVNNNLCFTGVCLFHKKRSTHLWVFVCEWVHLLVETSEHKKQTGLRSTLTSQQKKKKKRKNRREVKTGVRVKEKVGKVMGGRNKREREREREVEKHSNTVPDLTSLHWHTHTQGFMGQGLLTSHSCVMERRHFLLCYCVCVKVSVDEGHDTSRRET